MKRYATSSFLLLSILLIQNSRASNNGLSDELRFLHREIGLLRDENQNQNNEIAMLKDMVGIQINNTTQNNQIASLKTKELDAKKNMKSLPKSTDQDGPTSSMSSRRLKRPVRLLPPHLFRSERNETTPIPRFYGPPANCSDLAKLGYTLNGFYQVQSNASTTNEDGLTADTIYCAFKQPEGTFNPSAVQRQVSALKSNISKFYPNKNPSKSSGGVHFHAEMTSPIAFNHTESYTLLFDRIILNIGGHYNNNTGVFRVPKTGIYQFTFSGSMSYYEKTPGHIEDRFHIILQAKKSLTRKYMLLQAVDIQLLNQVTSKFYYGDEIYVTAKYFGVDQVDMLAATVSGLLLEEFVH